MLAEDVMPTIERLEAREDELKEALRGLLYVMELEDAPGPLPPCYRTERKAAIAQAFEVLGEPPEHPSERP
jgi:hypothetical protein